MRYNYILKFIIIGDASVGKSNILSSFLSKYYNAEHETTIGVDFGTKIVKRNELVYKLQIWDTAGQETFRSIVRAYYRGTVGCLLVYDVTNRKSFESLTYWIEDLKSNIPDVSVVLIGNKIDLNGSRVVSSDEGLEFAEKHNIIYFETSTKTSQNINECMMYLIDNASTQNQNLGTKTSNYQDYVQISNINTESNSWWKWRYSCWS